MEEQKPGALFRSARWNKRYSSLKSRSVLDILTTKNSKKHQAVRVIQHPPAHHENSVDRIKKNNRPTLSARQKRHTLAHRQAPTRHNSGPGLTRRGRNHATDPSDGDFRKVDLPPKLGRRGTQRLPPVFHLALIARGNKQLRATTNFWLQLGDGP